MTQTDTIRALYRAMRGSDDAAFFALWADDII